MDTSEKKARPKRRYVKKKDKVLSAADLIPDERGRPRIYNYSDEDIRRIEAMAMVGLPNENIAFVIGCNPATFQRHIAADRDKFMRGEAHEYNLYARLEKARSVAYSKIAKTAFDVATVDKNPTMLIWLTKTRLKWTESVEVNANVKNTIVYETQLANGVIRQDQKTLPEGEVIDALIDEVTEEVCRTP